MYSKIKFIEAIKAVKKCDTAIGEAYKLNIDVIDFPNCIDTVITLLEDAFKTSSIGEFCFNNNFKFPLIWWEEDGTEIKLNNFDEWYDYLIKDLDNDK